MSFFSLYRNELRRLALSKLVWAILVFILLGPLFGYSIICFTDASVMNGKYIANPVLAGTLIGSILWAVLAFLESDRIYRTKADVLTDAAVSPVRIVVIRLCALITLSTATTILCALAYLPYTAVKIDMIFDIGLYALSYLILMMPTIWISILLALTFYQITRRIELSGLLYVGMVYFSFSGFVGNDFFSCWLNPLFVDYTYSDGFTNAPTLRIAAYTRITWLALSVGAWVFSLMCVRCYEKRLIGSFLKGLRKIYLPLIAVVSACTGIFLWVTQPFVNHGPYEFYDYIENDSSSSGTSYASNVSYDIIANTSGSVNGTITYVMNNDSDSETQESLWFEPGYTIKSITCNGEEIDFKTLRNDINDQRETLFWLPGGSDMIVDIQYKGMPQLLRCFAPFSWNNVSTPGYFSLNNASTAPIQTSFSITDRAKLKLTLQEQFTPILDHVVLTNHTQNDNHTKTWETTCSGLGFWITACDYGSREFQAAGVTVNLLYSKTYEEIIDKYDISQAITDVMDYCTEHFIPLRFVSNGKLMMVQRNGSGSGNAGDGWVEWDETIFSELNLSDKLKGSSTSETFAHEIIHEWWGGLGVFCDDDGLWSDEGLTVYTTYRLMKEKYGEFYAKQNYIGVWQEAVNAQNRSYYNRHPEMFDKLPENYQAKLNAQAEQTNKYCRMPLMILKAESLVGGEEKMDEILQSIQKKYMNDPDKYTNPFTYQMFLEACGLEAEVLNLE